MEGINRKQWLIDNKLEDAIHVFESRNVEVEELLEFDKEDLKAFAIDVLHLDVLARNRFLKAIHALQTQQNDKQTVTKSSLSSIPTDFSFNFLGNNPQRQSIIVSSQENQAKQQLYQRNDEIAKLCYNLTVSIGNLDQSHIKMLAEIDHIFDIINNQLTQRKEILLCDIDRIQKQKNSELSQQLSSLEEYVLTLKETKNKYYKYIEDRNIDIRLRRKALLKLVKNALQQQNHTKHPSTAPKVQFIVPQKAWLHFMEHMMINNCDQPLSPALSIKKCTATSITVQWEINDNYTTDIINIQYAVLSKSVHMDHNEAHAKHKTEAKHNKHKNPITSLVASIFGTSKQNDGDIDTDSEEHDDDDEKENDSNSGSTHSSGYDTDSDIDTETYHKRKMKRKHKQRQKHHKEDVLTLQVPNNVDTDALDWKKVSVKSRKHHYREISGLHHDRLYVFRARGSNENGWGSFSACVAAKTDKLAFVSKIAKQREQTKLLSILRKHKKCIRIKGKTIKGSDIASLGWKLLFRASEYGFRSDEFYRKCVGKENTIVIAESDTNVFGGYINIAWMQPPAGNWVYGSDQNSFLFILRSRNKSDIGGYKVKKQAAQYAICCWDQYGPCFGQNCEIAISTACNTNTSSYSTLGSFEGITNNSQLGGSQNFKVKDYEVWQLKQ